MTSRIVLLLIAAQGVASAAYTYFWDSVPSPSDTIRWQKNGDLTAPLTTAPPSYCGSLIWKQPMSDGTQDHEVTLNTNWNPAGGFQRVVHYVRASLNASLELNTGSFYAALVQKPSAGAPFELSVYKRENNVTSLLYHTQLDSSSPGPVRLVSRTTGGGNTGLIVIHGAMWLSFPEYGLTTGQPGVGLCGTGVTVNPVRLGLADRIGPGAVGDLQATPFSSQVHLSWLAPQDDVNGTGIFGYVVHRNGTYLGLTQATTFVDGNVAPSTSYTYTVTAMDHHGNLNAVAAAITTDPFLYSTRRVGVEANGAHWGAMGEQVDMLSGNLNFTLPLLRAVSRGSWSAGLSLSYNSQSWESVGGTTIRHGADVGYGFGWRLMAGSIFPVYSDPSTLSHYLFTDSTGAEYKLDAKSGNVWWGVAGIRVYYDESLNRVYFNDGSFWFMDCISGGSEQDAGTRYPTLMQDSNGNQVRLLYYPAVGSSSSNTSARLKEIEDVRAPYWAGYRTFQFTYDTGSLPHLVSLVNNIQTAEKYTFGYSASVNLKSPFTSQLVGLSAPMLTSVLVTGSSLEHKFAYATNSSGEMTKVTFPYKGELEYTYITRTFAGNRKNREVRYRYFVKQAGAAQTSHLLTRDTADDTRLIHYYGKMADTADAASNKVWWFFQPTDWKFGLLQYLSESRLSTSVSLAQSNYTWALSAGGFPYVASVESYVDVGLPGQKASRVDQTVDPYGNLVQRKEYDYGATVPARTTNCTFQTNVNYVSRYLRNLPISCTLTVGGQNYTLFTRSYDSGNDSQVLTGLRLHDSANYGNGFWVRGNLSNWSTLDGSSGWLSSNMTGKTTSSSTNGTGQTATYNSTYSAPSVVTTNGNSQIQTTLTFNSFLGLSNATQANGTSVAATYDTYARPAGESTPDGWVSFTYDDALRTRTSTLGTRWTKSYFDGIGRLIKEQTGDGGGVKSTVETEYEPCACSPMGKVKRVSRPYGPGQSASAWTVYNYDGLGRTLSVTQPGNSGTTSYVYAGSTVTTTGPSGKWKKHLLDAFGQLIQVNEPNPQGGADFVSTYAYSGLGQLTQVSMPRATGTQTRTFAYTGLQLTSETHPETGTTSYVYTGSRLASKTDAKGQRTEFSYDTYGRVTQERHYTALNVEMPCDRVDYRYDSYDGTAPVGFGGTALWGRLAETKWGVEDPAVCGAGQFREQFGYDGSGRTVGKTLRFRRNDPNRPWVANTGPNKGEAVLRADWSVSLGRVASIQYSHTLAGGSGTFDPPTTVVGGPATAHTMNAMMQFTGLNAGNPYQGIPSTAIVANAAYGLSGELTQMQSNGVTEARSYNVLGQLTGISYNGTLRHEYRYSATANDGRITSYKNHQSGEDVEYQYDSLGRLAQAQTVGPQWGQAFSYDGFGNLVAKSVTKGSAPVLNVTASAATNRLNVSGMTYDANGNVTAMPGVGAMTYDGRNRYNGSVTGLTPPDRGYDPSNRRIWRKVGDEIEVDFFLPGGEKLGTYATFLHNGHGQDGSNEAEGCQKATNNPGQKYCIGFAAVKTNYYFGGRLVKSEEPGSTWYRADRLGSHGQHHPYGEQRSGTTWQDPGFATYWRESSGLDYAMNRHYSSTFGRFTSADPYRASGGPADPGSWNRYGYVGGDPVNFVDPEGLCKESVEAHSMTICSGPLPPLEVNPSSIVGGIYQYPSPLSPQQQDYESGACTTSWGLPCYEVDSKLRRLTELTTEACSLSEHITAECGSQAVYINSLKGAVGGMFSRLVGAASLAWWAAAQAVGRAGEQAVSSIIKLEKNTRALSGTNRIPDFMGLEARTIYEVKNASYVSFTSQLRDMSSWAINNGYRFQLWVNGNTTLSSELQKAIGSGLIEVQRFPWP